MYEFINLALEVYAPNLKKLNPDSTDSEIKLARKTLAQKMHPDRNGLTKDMQELMSAFKPIYNKSA